MKMEGRSLPRFQGSGNFLLCRHVMYAYSFLRFIVFKKAARGDLP